MQKQLILFFLLSIGQISFARRATYSYSFENVLSACQSPDLTYRNPGRKDLLLDGPIKFENKLYLYRTEGSANKLFIYSMFVQLSEDQFVVPRSYQHQKCKMIPGNYYTKMITSFNFTLYCDDILDFLKDFYSDNTYRADELFKNILIHKFNPLLEKPQDKFLEEISTSHSFIYAPLRWSGDEL